MRRLNSQVNKSCNVRILWIWPWTTKYKRRKSKFHKLSTLIYRQKWPWKLVLRTLLFDSSRKKQIGKDSWKQSLKNVSRWCAADNPDSGRRFLMSSTRSSTVRPILSIGRTVTLMQVKSKKTAANLNPRSNGQPQRSTKSTRRSLLDLSGRRGPGTIGERYGLWFWLWKLYAREKPSQRGWKR